MASSYNTRSSAAATTTSPSTRRFCVVLTNNPRMIPAAQRNLQNVSINATNQPERREPQTPTSLPTPPSTRSTRSRSSLQLEQQVPMSELPATTAVIASQMRAHEQEIEDDFRAQVQPFLQIYLQKTRRASPINSVLDMSNHIRL